MFESDSPLRTVKTRQRSVMLDRMLAHKGMTALAMLLIALSILTLVLTIMGVIVGFIGLCVWFVLSVVGAVFFVVFHYPLVLLAAAILGYYALRARKKKVY